MECGFPITQFAPATSVRPRFDGGRKSELMIAGELQLKLEHSPLGAEPAEGVPRCRSIDFGLAPLFNQLPHILGPLLARLFLSRDGS